MERTLGEEGLAAAKGSSSEEEEEEEESCGEEEEEEPQPLPPKKKGGKKKAVVEEEEEEEEAEHKPAPKVGSNAPHLPLVGCAGTLVSPHISTLIVPACTPHALRQRSLSCTRASAHRRPRSGLPPGAHPGWQPSGGPGRRTR